MPTHTDVSTTVTLFAIGLSCCLRGVTALRAGRGRRLSAPRRVLAVLSVVIGPILLLEGISAVLINHPAATAAASVVVMHSVVAL